MENGLQKQYYSCTLETKLISFQLKLNHRAIVTNTQLNGFDLIDSSTYGFCNLENEILMHLFCDWYVICDFWNLKLLNCVLLTSGFLIYSYKYSKIM